MQSISITGPDALNLELPELLFGALRPPWLEEWEPMLTRIEQVLKNGNTIPYLQIAKLGYAIIQFYSSQRTEKVQFSYAQEIFQIVAHRIVSACIDGPVRDEVHDYMVEFGPLIKSACGPPPDYVIVLATVEPTQFGIDTPTESTTIMVDSIELPDRTTSVVRTAVFDACAHQLPANLQRVLGAQPPAPKPISFF